MYPNFISKDYSNLSNIIIILNILDRKRRHILNAIICHQNIGKASKINKLLITNINRESVIHQKRLHLSNKANQSKLRQITLKQVIYENINRSISTKYLYSARSRKVSGNFSIFLIINNNSKLNTSIKGSMITWTRSASPRRSLLGAIIFLVRLTLGLEIKLVITIKSFMSKVTINSDHIFCRLKSFTKLDI